ncbi:phosphatase PAP2 family protein [Hymenobacter sp. BT594]|uniref:Phosphatase PAP2 family protein n=1 Tax=Hymenobacter guriensis TaxID=2793065 RepID=A0ABS0L7E7_9BACT|nr:phosphatase PAP2 family protein [Hymenobacter guriensis]
MYRSLPVLVSGLLLLARPGHTQHLLPSTPDSVAPAVRSATWLSRSTHWAGQPAHRRVLVPALLFSAGALTTRRVELVASDEQVREEVQEHVPVVRTSLDDQLRHLPAATALGLSLLGVQGRHSTLNQALLFTLTYSINNMLTSNLKHLTRVERPQGTGFDSFPSQHTSAAFSAARFLDREYGQRSVWYSVGGYTVATGVATLRVVKQKHWLSDVLAGAGVGMASTELAYWVYPWLHRQLRKGLGERAVVLPSYLNGAAGATVVVVL